MPSKARKVGKYLWEVRIHFNIGKFETHSRWTRKIDADAEAKVVSRREKRGHPGIFKRTSVVKRTVY